MRKRRWAVRLGAALIVFPALVAVAAAPRLQTGVDAGATSDVRLAAPCPASPVNPGRPMAPRRGTWWRVAEQLDDTGALIGRRLFVGLDSAPRAFEDLAPESGISGPVGGIVVASTDDGGRSEIRLIAVRDGCAWIAFRSREIIRSAILAPRDGALYLHLLDRSSRVDRGMWRLADPGDPGARPMRVAAPLSQLGTGVGAAGSIGTVWATQLRLDATGTHLAVQSCGDLGCIVRVVDLRDGSTAPPTVGGGDQGDLLGFAGDDVVTWGRCPGLPCSIEAWSPAGGQPRTLVEAASSAALTGDGRRLAAVAVSGPTARALEVDPATGAARPLADLPAGLAPLPLGLGASTGLEVAGDEIVIGSPTSDPRPFRPDDLEMLP